MLGQHSLLLIMKGQVIMTRVLCHRHFACLRHELAHLDTLTIVKQNVMIDGLCICLNQTKSPFPSLIQPARLSTIPCIPSWANPPPSPVVRLPLSWVVDTESKPSTLKGYPRTSIYYNECIRKCNGNLENIGFGRQYIPFVVTKYTANIKLFN